MIRQTGLALGVAVLVAVLGSGAANRSSLDAFRHAWWLTAGVAFLAIIPAVGLLRRATPAAG